MRARDIMGRQVRQLQRLVDDLMDVAAVAEGKIVLRRERVDLRQIVEDAATAARNATDERGQSLSLAVPAAPVWIDADGGRLQQVFSNLLTNAAKYTQNGGNICLEMEVRAGLGIGLKVVRGLVELHGGRVEARSEGPDQGSEFIVTLPVGAAQSQCASALL